MRFLLSVTFLGAAIWAGYWYLGSNGAEIAIQQWFDQRRAAGWTAEFSDMNLIGFPSRFDTTFTNISLADPVSDYAWDAPFFQLLSLSYRPNHVIAVWPEKQQIKTPAGSYQIQSTKTRASLIADIKPTLPLNRLTFTSEAINIQSENGKYGGISARNLALAAERKPITAQPNYRLGLSVEAVQLLSDWRANLNTPVDLPDTLSMATADITVRLNAIPELNAQTITPLQLEEIDLDLIHVQWGDMDIHASGKLNIDINGTLNGGITFKAQNWQQLLTLLQATGGITTEQSETATRILMLAAQQDQNPDTLDIPLHISNGQIYLGPVAIATVPQLPLR